MSTEEKLPEMEYRFLGRSGLKVSVLGLGAWLTYGGTTEDEIAFSCMKAAYDAGVNFFDTAEGYSSGNSERTVGAAIRKFGWRRCDIVIATKLYWGTKCNSSGPSKAQNSVGLSRKHIIEGCNASLERLGLDYVDLIYAHRPDRLTPMEETVRAFNWLIEQGKAFYWGTSGWTAEEIQDAWRVAEKLNLIGPVMEQPEYNLAYREPVEKLYTPLYRKHGLGLTIFSPLKFGFLTGKYDDFVIPEKSRFASAANDAYISGVVAKLQNKDPEAIKNIEVSRALKPIADELGVTQAQLALAWVVKNPNVSSAIMGASRPEQVIENIKALKVLPLLTPEVMERIDKATGMKPVPDVMRY